MMEVEVVISVVVKEREKKMEGAVKDEGVSWCN